MAFLLFGVLFLGSAGTTYLLFVKNTEQMVYGEIEQNAIIAAHYYLEEDEITQKEHQEIESQFSIIQLTTELRIYDEFNVIKFGEREEDEQITRLVLNEIRKQGSLRFASSDNYYVGIFYPDNQGDFVLVAKQDRQFFVNQVNALLRILTGVFVIGIGVIFLFSRVLTWYAFRPVNQLIDEVNSLDLSKISRLLQNPQTKDELERLTETFNHLLGRLSESFAVQQNFINYVSQEFKKPLTAISGSLEVFAQKERSPEEYQEVVKEALVYVHQIEEILKTLLLVSGIKNSPPKKERFRLDELLWEIVDRLGVIYPAAKPTVTLAIPTEQSKLLQMKTDRGGLQLALFNIIENAIKYAEGSIVKIDIAVVNTRVQMKIADQGKGIPAADLPHVTLPFYRGSNMTNTKGSGIGLSLASIIFKQNNIDMQIQSKEAIGTTITITF
jgi:two-component system, OmpR family, sensor histidine kinase ArlS